MTTSLSTYRPEIDGLRAFAVIAVVVNHFNERLMPSGHLGVDIFFVISGYVITSSLSSRHESTFGQFLSSFYQRRLKRLLPALIVYILVMSILICLFNPDPSSALSTGLKAIFGFSNLQLIHESTDYFAPETDLNPFTHTWSLGVEEQFYMIFPFIFWFACIKSPRWGGGAFFAWLMTSLVIASLVGFVYYFDRNQPFAYFAMPTRFWEIGIGCLSYLAIENNQFSKWAWTSFVPQEAIFVLMVAVLFLPTELGLLSTISIVLLTSALLLKVKDVSLVYRCLTDSRILFIGLISYSLYLWHWGVFAIAKWTVGGDPRSLIIQLILSFILAWLSYKYIETPFRGAKFSLPSWGLFAIAALTIYSSFISIFVLQKNFTSRLYLGKSRTHLSDYILPDKNSCNIFSHPHEAMSLSDNCGQTLSPERPTVYMLGDSHMHIFTGAIAKFAGERGYNVKTFWGNACMFPQFAVRKTAPGPANPMNGRDCYTRSKILESKLVQKLRPGDVVFVSNILWGMFSPANSGDWKDWKSNEFIASNGTEIPPELARLKYRDGLLGLSQRLVARGAKVVIYVDSALFPRLGKKMICSNQWFRPVISPDCYIELDQYLKQRDSVVGWLDGWGDFKNKFVWDGLDPLTCSNGKCSAVHYSDDNHFYHDYANYIFLKFMRDHPSLLPELPTVTSS